MGGAPVIFTRTDDSFMAFRPLEPQWHIDPTSRHQLRFWDGTAWTARVADDGVESSDPLPAVGVVPTEFVRPETPAKEVAGHEATPRVDQQGLAVDELKSPPDRSDDQDVSSLGEKAEQTVPTSRVAQTLTLSTDETDPPDIFNFDSLDGGGFEDGAVAPPEAIDLDRLDQGSGRRLALLGGGLVALIAVLAFVGLQVRGSNDGDRADGSAADETASTVALDEQAPAASFPTSAERDVIDRLPGGFSCERAPVDPADPVDFLARVSCTPGEEGSIDLIATSFEGRSKGDLYLNSLASDAGATAVIAAQSVDCSTATEGLWAGGGATGRIVCIPGTSGANLAWTVGSEPVVNVASNSGSSADLLAWWSSSAVPGPVSILEPFPTQSEAVALAKLPADLSATCTRFVGEPTASALSSLECRPASGAEVVYIDSFDADFDVADYYKAFDLPRPDKGGCRLGVRGNNRFVVDGAEVGRVGCYVSEGRSWVQWYDTRSQLTGQASFVDDDVTQPFEWWSSTAVPGAEEQRTFDRTETRVLASVPETIASSCVAEPVKQTERFAARLRCVPEEGGILSVTYFGFKTPKRIANEYKERRGEIKEDSGSCTSAGAPGESTWRSGDRSGRQLCQVVSGVAEIYSIDSASKLAVLIVSEGGDLDSLVTWLDANR